GQADKEARAAARLTLERDGMVASASAACVSMWAVESESGGGDPHGEKRVQANLVRDVAGNPFRPPCLDRAWMKSEVRALAQAAYDERVLPSGELDPQRLAILADALEECGCTNADILDHLRGPGTHVRGCFVLDCLLGKAAPIQGGP